MRAVLSSCVLFSLAMVVGGCNERAAKAPPVKPPPPPVVVQPIVDPIDLIALEEMAVPQAGLPFELEPYVQPQRLIVFTSQGPIRVDVLLWIDDQPYDHAMEELVDHVLKLADANGDGKATWDELADQPELRSGQFGNLSFEDPRQRKQNIDRYDTNRNGWVDRAEVPRMVSRSSARTEAFSVRRTSYAVNRSRTDSPLRQMLDENSDGVIDSEEIATAANRLRLRDLDDDEIVTPMELITASGRSMTDMTRSGDRRRFFGGQGMFTLDDSTPWNDLLYAMQENYERGGQLQLDKFPSENLLHTIDADADGVLSKEELPKLASLPPEYELTIRFGDDAEKQPRISMTPFRMTSAEPITKSNEVSVNLGTDWLVFRMRDNVSSEFALRQAESLLQTYDGNQDGYLEESELPEQGTNINFAMADKDKDEKLYVEEIEASLLQRNWVQRCHIRLQGIDGDDPLFRAVDPVRDGRLSARELKQLEKQFASMDADKSHSIEFDEIPSLLVFEFFRGEQDDNQLVRSIYTPPGDATEINELTPDWFSGMDYNGDGDISIREFLGTPDQFSKLDADNDGFITAAEALSTPDVL
ncbi:hypothetical protein C5Y96_06085 [Blastopirellula marina]|uniref:EF-hand domain-containing protein n=1 Tax=Blastopirellula marina TaxID=124 RepID=A0A2S8FX49_9BACT|nr:MULTISPECIES: hypothetical protein [Pirellulaceae]PQO36739.1 hypothetical protein C5Y96_06085 [Blastopirellula marina]RCS53454.1 hypothetical protein DTL36_06095 [Bremerella cremea]